MFSMHDSPLPHQDNPQYFSAKPDGKITKVSTISWDNLWWPLALLHQKIGLHEENKW